MDDIRYTACKEAGSSTWALKSLRMINLGNSEVQADTISKRWGRVLNSALGDRYTTKKTNLSSAC